MLFSNKLMVSFSGSQTDGDRLFVPPMMLIVWGLKQRQIILQSLMALVKLYFPRRLNWMIGQLEVSSSATIRLIQSALGPVHIGRRKI